jgi:hypothetical protein
VGNPVCVAQKVPSVNDLQRDIRTSLRRYTVWMKFLPTSILAICLVALHSTNCAAQEREENGLSEMSREEWQAYVKASRQRAETMRREGRRFVPLLPTVDEIAEQASRRILEDDSLQPGDIISTNRGLFRFQGAPDRERKPDDFVRIR